MSTKIDPLHFKLTIIKKMLEEMQESLDADYQVDETLQEIIDIVGEAIVMCSTISVDKDKPFEIFENPSITIPKSLAID